jgi:hypothetical protein
MPVFVGLVMSLAAIMAALLIAATYPLGTFPELVETCAGNGLDAMTCGDAALKIGWYSLAAFAAVIVITAYMWHYASRWEAKSHTPIHPIVTKSIVAVTMGLVAAHYVTQLYSPAYSSRMDEVVRYLHFVAIENLLWPLLLQLFVTESEGRIRIGILTALVAIMALTPYRSVYLAIPIFGFATPILGDMARDIRLRGLSVAISRSAKPAALAALVAVCAIWSGYVDGAGRDLSNRLRGLEQPTAQAEAPPQARQFQVTRLAQRVVHPLVQAAILEHLTTQMPVPSFMDELRWKFRLGSRLPLSQFLYEKEYHSGQGVGGTNFLYYGEAAAYMPHLMVLWMVAAPLLIVVVWLALRRKIADVGTICGIQMWRSSLAGIVTILPALIVQVLAMTGMVFLSRRLASSSSLKWLSGASTSVVLLAIATAVGLQCWTIGRSRDAILAMEVAPPQGCAFVKWGDMPHTVDAVLADHGVKIASGVWIGDRYDEPLQPNRPVMLLIPQGHAAKRLAGELLDRLGANIRCGDKPTPAPPRMIAEQFIERKGNLPLELLVVGFGLLTLVWFVRDGFVRAGKGYNPANVEVT